MLEKPGQQDVVGRPDALERQRRPARVQLRRPAGA